MFLCWVGCLSMSLAGGFVDISNHFSMVMLFDQLGLASDKKSIKYFFKIHSLPSESKLHEANIWTPIQASFLKEAIEEDSDWSNAVDHLDVELRK